MLRRKITQGLIDALADTPVVLVQGARQTGKTTLVQSVAEGRPARRYLTLDDASVLGAAKADPAGFLAGLDGPVVIDEVQRAPELFPVMKAIVDRNRTPGRFLLTGSANVLLLPKLAESLAGRMEVLTLWPFSQDEIDASAGGFIDGVFGEKLPAPRKGACKDLDARIVRGGFPEIVSRASEERRAAWFGSYLTTILQRDVRDIANIEGLAALPRMLALLASRTSGLLNFSDLSRVLSVPQTTLKRYFALVEATFLVVSLPAWSADLGQRLVKSPKLFLSDTGLGAHLLGLGRERLSRDGAAMGPLLENLIVMELRKQAAWSRVRAQMFHFRTPPGRKVDVLLEDASGRIVGIDIRASATVGPDDFKGLRTLAGVIGKRFVRGVVLYTGGEQVGFGENLVAMPVSGVWT